MNTDFKICLSRVYLYVPPRMDTNEEDRVVVQDVKLDDSEPFAKGVFKNEFGRQRRVDAEAVMALLMIHDLCKGVRV